MKCKYCGYETNPGGMYKYTPKFCSWLCQESWERRKNGEIKYEDWSKRDENKDGGNNE